MPIPSTIRKLLFISLWVLIGGGMVLLLVSAMKLRSEKTCRGFEIKIVGGGGPAFIDRKMIEDVLNSNGSLPVKGRRLKSFDLRRMEASLEKNRWIRNAELFIDNNQVLRVSISQKEPVARVFTTAGNSFYVDSSCQRLPLAGDRPARVPVFTGYPWDKPGKQEKSLLKEIKVLGSFILDHPFWMAEVAQVDINDHQQFEMIPTMGNHIVELGNADDCDKKFARLFLFYQEVITKTGFNKYSRVKVQYEKQVIAVKKDMQSRRTDSIEAIRIIEQWINQANANSQQALTEAGRGIERTGRDSIETANIQLDKSPITISSHKNSSLKSHPPYGSGQSTDPLKRKFENVKM